MLADHFGRDVNVVRAGQIIRLGRAQETETVLQHLENAIPTDHPLLVGPLAQDGEHHVALPHRRRILDLEFLGEREKILRALGL